MGSIDIAAEVNTAGSSAGVAGRIPSPASEPLRPAAVIARRDIELPCAQNVRDPELIGGVLNVADRGPSTAGDDIEESDFPFAAVQGRTLFLNAKYTFGS